MSKNLQVIVGVAVFMAAVSTVVCQDKDKEAPMPVTLLLSE
jgi:hypothetical protein